MNTRTTDHMELIVANFYKTHKLEDAVKLYDEGKKISEACTEILEKAKQKIEVVE